jgi:hypothetical protein
MALAEMACVQCGRSGWTGFEPASQWQSLRGLGAMAWRCKARRACAARAAAVRASRWRWGS